MPQKALGGAVAAASYPLPRAMFTKESWTLEPPAVMALLEKIRRNGVPLKDYAGVSPLYGIKTGFNPAFLIDTPTRERLVAEDPGCAEIIKPYLRGQDIERWWSEDSGLFIILMKSSGDHAWPWAGAGENAEQVFALTYPSLYRHFKAFEPALRGRLDQGRFWWELRTCAYYAKFVYPKIHYQVIQFYPSYSLDEGERFWNDKTFFVPAAEKWLLGVLNSPLIWWNNWRFLTHLKDEALSPMSYRMEALPIAPLSERHAGTPVGAVSDLISRTRSIAAASGVVVDWLRHEFGVEAPGGDLREPHRLDADGFAAAVRKALPKGRRLSAAEIARLKQEHADTVEPARRAGGQVLALERRLSDLVNEAYGLTPDEVRLLWDTAPPRMPLDPAAERARLAATRGGGARDAAE